MHITIFHCAFIYTGGGERIVLGQYDQLTRRGHQVEIFTPVFDPGNCYPDIIDRYPIKTLLPQLPRWVPFRHALLMVATCLLAPLLAWRFRRSDIFIGENQPGVWLAWCVSKVLGKPYLVYLCHPNKMVYPRPYISRQELWQAVRDFYLLSLVVDLTRPLIAWLDRISVRAGRSVLVNGYFIGQEVEKVYNVKWQGCPSGSFLLPDEQLATAPEYHFSGEVALDGVTISKPFLLFTGRHEVWKRIDLAIMALAEVVRQHPHIYLVIPGPFTKYTLKLQELAGKQGLTSQVVFTGPVSQSSLKTLYKEAVVYVFPSTMEDFGIVVLEAMGSGTPVVAWDTAGPTDTVVDGVSGFLAKPYQVDDFADKVSRLLNSPEKRGEMGAAAHRHAKENFSWERHLATLEGALKEAKGD